MFAFDVVELVITAVLAIAINYAVEVPVFFRTAVTVKAITTINKIPRNENRIPNTLTFFVNLEIKNSFFYFNFKSKIFL